METPDASGARHDVARVPDAAPAPVLIVWSMFEAFNHHDADELALHYTDDAVLVTPGYPETRGAFAVREFFGAYFGSAPDAYADIERVIVGSGRNPDAIVVQLTVRGRPQYEGGTDKGGPERPSEALICSVLDLRGNLIERCVTYTASPSAEFERAL